METSSKKEAFSPLQVQVFFIPTMNSLFSNERNFEAQLFLMNLAERRDV